MEWEIVHERWHPERKHIVECTDRMRVPGGWLYRTALWDRGPTVPGMAMAFVPDTQTEI